MQKRKLRRADENDEEDDDQFSWANRRSTLTSGPTVLLTRVPTLLASFAAVSRQMKTKG